MKSLPRAAAVAGAIGLSITAVLAGQAHAAGSNSGYKSCAPAYVGATSDGTLYVTATPPGNTVTIYSVQRHVVEVPGASTSGNWVTKATGTYYGGYAWCGGGI